MVWIYVLDTSSIIHIFFYAKFARVGIGFVEIFMTDEGFAFGANGKVFERGSEFMTFHGKRISKLIV